MIYRSILGLIYDSLFVTGDLRSWELELELELEIELELELELELEPEQELELELASQLAS